MNAQPTTTNAGDRVHYCAWYLGYNDQRRYLGYAIRKPGESDLDAALRSIRRRLDVNGFEIGKHTALDDGSYKFPVLSRLTRSVREDFGEGWVRLLHSAPPAQAPALCSPSRESKAFPGDATRRGSYQTNITASASSSKER